MTTATGYTQISDLSKEQRDRLKLLILHHLGKVQTQMGELIHDAAAEFSLSMEHSTDEERQEYIDDLLECIYATEFVKISFN